MKDVLTSTNFHDETGVVSVNVVDAMMAIANAIHRLAASHEAMAAKGDKISTQLREALHERLTGEDGTGHA